MLVQSTDKRQTKLSGQVSPETWLVHLKTIFRRHPAPLLQRRTGEQRQVQL